MSCLFLPVPGGLVSLTWTLEVVLGKLLDWKIHTLVLLGLLYFKLVHKGFPYRVTA